MLFLGDRTFWGTWPTRKPARVFSFPRSFPNQKGEAGFGGGFFSPSFFSSVKLRHYSPKMGFEPVEINLVWQEVCK